MDKTKREELEKAYRKEKDSRVVPRMLAVHLTYYRTVRFKLDIFKFAHRKVTALCTN